MYAQIPKLLIECPNTLQTAFGADNCYFEVFAGVFCLKLLLSPNEYKPNASYNGGDPGYLRVLNAPQYQVRAQVSSYDIAVTDERDYLFFILQRISELSTLSDRRTKYDVKVFDFILPEAQDVEIARTSNLMPYTLRIGAFQPPQPQGGRVVMGTSQGWIKGGFTVKFEEKKTRIR